MSRSNSDGGMPKPRSPRSVGMLADLVAQLPHLMQDGLRPLLQGEAGLGELHALVGADEQQHAEIVLEELDLPRERRLRRAGRWPHA